MDVREDICTIDDLKSDPYCVIQKARLSRRPMVVTVDGDPEVILLPKELLASKRFALEAACELAEVAVT